jgi:uncharacterized phage-associated protein
MKEGLMVNLNKYRFLNIEKIIQIFYYIQKFSKTDSKIELIKFLFFGDRIHIREHFSLISLDRYEARKFGPVASIALDILNKNKENLNNYQTNEMKYLDKIIKINNYTRKINKVAFDLLSKNEMHSLDKSIELFSGTKLVDISHDYPEWKRFQDLFEKHLISSEIINIEDFFENPDINNSPAIQKYFNGKDPLYKDVEFLKEAKQFYLESMV